MCSFNYFLTLLILAYLAIAITANSNIVFPCKTPNNDLGLCVSIFSCPILMKSLGSLKGSAIDFVKKSVCCECNPYDLMVCCGTKGNYIGQENITLHDEKKCPTEKIVLAPHTTLNPTTNPTTTLGPELSTAKNADEPERRDKEEERKMKLKLLPSRKFCGLQHTDDRFYMENDTALDEFPWMAHVVFLEDEDEDPLQYLDRCNGFLINKRYVLTTGSCANYARSVRLGQHHVNKTVSCVDNPGFPECSEPRYDIKIEEEIHRINDSIQSHDFALVRMASDVQFTDFVRPICLPLEKANRATGPSLVFSGWGALGQETPVIKKRLTYNETDDTESCLRLDYKNELKVAAKNVSVICLLRRSENTELACTGDEGGPLMYKNKRDQWFAEGLITKVFDWYSEAQLTGVFVNVSHNDDCSNELPVAGIRITSDILDWILDSIRA